MAAMLIYFVFFLFGFAAVTAIPCNNDQQESSLSNSIHFQYLKGTSKHQLIDQWTETNNLGEAAKYNAEIMNTYHLFTRQNPSLSHPLLINNNEWLSSSNFNCSRRTIVLIHGWLDTVTSDFNTILVPGKYSGAYSDVLPFLETVDVNVIVVDWSFGSGTMNYPVAVINTSFSGEAVANFIKWLNQATGASLKDYHIVGHSHGAHQAGIVGRYLDGQVGYITALDPTFPGWVTNDNKFQSTDGIYTEVIHTNAGVLGYVANLGDVDFYPNGGYNMPGCISQECDHNRSFFYFAESIRTGGFTGIPCHTFAAAMAGQCFMWGSLKMGGIDPKTGLSGIYYLETNAFPPFSQY